jgi:hypothetical protein
MKLSLRTDFFSTKLKHCTECYYALCRGALNCCNLFVRLRSFRLNATVFKERVQGLQGHRRAVLGEADLVQNANGSESIEVFLPLLLVNVMKT